GHPSRHRRCGLAARVSGHTHRRTRNRHAAAMVDRRRPARLQRQNGGGRGGHRVAYRATRGQMESQPEPAGRQPGRRRPGAARARAARRRRHGAPGCRLPRDVMTLPQILGLFALTALAEIIGCYLPYLWLKQGYSAWLLVPAAASLALFAWLLTLHPTAAGRVYAAYGGVYVSMALLWLW